MPATQFAATAMVLATLSCAATAAESGQPTYTLSDDRLSATFGATASDFGLLTELRMPGAASVITGGTPGDVWRTSFVGTGTGTASISSSSASCRATEVATTSATALTFRWVDCTVDLPSVVPPPQANVTWVEHNASTCTGLCLRINSKGPNGGHCDRMPGCGHDAGLPYCKAEAMQARCLNATGCTAFNTNGYLYQGGGAAPFSAYPLECYVLGGSLAKVNVTLDVLLTSGQLEYVISFGSNGAISLWDYTLSLSRVTTTATTSHVQTTSARQLLGLYDSAVSSGNAVYFAAHDPAQIVKTCSQSVSSTVTAMSCTMMAINATLPLLEYRAAFPIVVTVATGDWWDIVSIYRAWVLPNAHWTRLGPLDARTDLPDWLENITLWMNNNWGGDPLGPNYGGDPMYVQNEMLKVNAVLNLPAHGGHLALHWYEWDTLGYALGSNHTKCGPPAPPCGFDTHYPDYFPARVGCKESVKAMQDAGMRVIPYINGQLYDTRISRWKADNASLAVQKFVAETMKTNASQPALTPHLEHFDGITSAVMCPATKYWHGVMRDTMLEIVNEIGFDGVYVDQVGNGEKRNCGDPSHNHTIHGGSFWAEAFYGIMADVRAGVPRKSSMFMTEGITEEVSGAGFDILLGLNWNEPPYWSAIYGGYGYATGSAGSVRSPLSGGLCTELTSQFMVGGTMGWFTYQNYKNQFFDPANAPEVAYIQKLSQARIAAKDWMVHGRATRPLLLNDASGTLKHGCFLRAKPGETASVVCAVALPTSSAATAYTLSMEPSKYGLIVPSGWRVALTDLLTSTVLGTFPLNITYSASVPTFGLQLLKLSVEKPASVE